MDEKPAKRIWVFQVSTEEAWLTLMTDPLLAADHANFEPVSEGYFLSFERAWAYYSTAISPNVSLAQAKHDETGERVAVFEEGRLGGVRQVILFQQLDLNPEGT